MIEINLLPGGGGRKAKSRGGGGGIRIDFKAMLAGFSGRFTDKFLLSAVGAATASALFIGTLYTRQTYRAVTLAAAEEHAIKDPTRLAIALAEKIKTEAIRDTALRQINIIKSIDDDRSIWPHVMDEVSRALPPYTWLTSLMQTSAPVLAVPPAPTRADSAKKAPGKAKAVADTAGPPPLRFRLVGHTVDIQALTRFMKDLEASPFVQGVTLNKTTLIPADGKEVTQFELDCEYQTPDPAAIQTVAVSTEVR